MQRNVDSFGFAKELVALIRKYGSNVSVHNSCELNYLGVNFYTLPMDDNAGDFLQLKSVSTDYVIVKKDVDGELVSKE